MQVIHPLIQPLCKRAHLRKNFCTLAPAAGQTQPPAEGCGLLVCGVKVAFRYHQNYAPPANSPYLPPFCSSNYTPQTCRISPSAGWAAHSITTTPFSIKQAKQVVKFAASALCCEKAEGMPCSAGCFPLGAGKVFDAFPKQPT